VVVEVLGLVWSCWVSAANKAEVKAVPTLLVPLLETMTRWQKILADQAYRGEIATTLEQLYGCTLDLTEKLGQGFTVEPWRWVVERTFSWLENSN
jgi:putative transposase